MEVAVDSESSWFLSQEVFRSLRQIVDVVDECLEAFPAAVPDAPESAAHRERFVMQQSSYAGSSGGDTAKCVLLLCGAHIVHAELQIKIQKHPNVIHKTSVGPERAWLLTQVQDSNNLLAESRGWLQRALDVEQEVRTAAVADPALLQYVADRLGFILDQLMQRLRRGRDCLLSPRKKTIEDHLTSDNMKSLCPPLPGDIAVSFYVQGQRLMLAIYHLVSQQGSVHFDSFLAETTLPKLSHILLCFTRAFQLCQQIKNKLYWANKCHQHAISPALNTPVHNGV